MRYVFLAYKDERQSDALSAHERATLESACTANEQDLRQSGRLLAVEDLPSGHTAITVRLVNGRLSVADGSSSETKGELSQLFFINARDLNEAIQVAARMPQLRHGPIEVRPMMEPVDKLLTEPRFIQD